MTEEVVRANGVELCVETFGSPEDAAVLLIAGMTGSMDNWGDGFCAGLAARGRFVIRYDHRDTGRSVAYPPGEPGYTGRDLAEDAVGVLDALGVARAHVVGLSMGGGIGQVLALDHPDRVATLTLVATSPVVPTPHELPPPAPSLAAYFAAGGTPEPDWTSRESVVEYLVAGNRPFLGTHPVDEDAARALAGRVFDRSPNIAGSNNHVHAAGGGESRSRLADVVAPTLVAHGELDPLFPLAHGEALVAEIPGAILLVLPGTGHELPAAVWGLFTDRLVEHTA
ncbi:alpha/beta hydrolase [Actinosynnema sp. NPDC047251]|uniref:Alpha/beta hydrolase fold containing protein n=1 Tax=Saccharothrix espanaensis (strain ATCC 51144 / DSM 44229 / JCM 9112 / NBRC 15066 / NRRL 15764) TaxID=1179773 RepID=K0K0C6_SACES|nr:alpha/beta hydrolase [Saccharothrix espanaensis]CCH33690.1 alpha/beta hydrolase fold containing protein [Saccharothrix espanaensis DSM 44229]